MAISPINITRVSHSLRTSLVIDSLQRTQRELFTSQVRIASGRSFVSPSEDPVSASRVLDLSGALARNEQFRSNLFHGDNFLSVADSTLSEISNLLIEASVIASQNVGSLASAEEREAEAELVAGIRQQLQSVANRALFGRFIFAGRSTTDRPFIDALGGVAYVGDVAGLFTRADEGTLAPISIPGSILFGALSAPVASNKVLTPALAASTRLGDINGLDPTELKNGVLMFNEADGAGAFTVSLSGAETIDDVVTIINSAAEEAGAGFTVSFGASGLVVTPGANAITIGDRSVGALVRALGISTSEPTRDVITGQALTPRLTRLTPVEMMAGGAGIDLDSGFIISNADRSAEIDLSGAETVQDIINTINNAGIYVLARINESGTAIDLLNQVSGTSLTIGENGGSTATDLGIRTFDTATPLAKLNFGRGVGTVAGVDDLRITAKSGSTVDVNLDTALTIGDVIDLINDAATESGVAVTATLATDGNGISLKDSTSGDGDFSVGILNVSTAAIDLGLMQSVSGTAVDLLGDDVNPTRTDGIIGVLFELERAMRHDDTPGMTEAGNRLDGLRNQFVRQQGLIGARSRAMKSKLAQMEDASTTTKILLSQVQDLDFAEAATALQGAMTQLQANMQASSRLLGMSLMDFLR